MRSTRRPPPDQLQPYLLDVPHPRASPLPDHEAADSGLWCWPAVFGNDRPVEIEVGSGKGLFLLEQSQARADVNFLGIEIERKYALFTAARLAKRQLANVRLACTDARWLLRERVPAHSVATVHVYFPDPWWKKRHHKRRVFTAEFAEQIARVLSAGGHLHFASDVEAYFETTVQMLSLQGRLQRLPETAVPEGGATNFDRKYRLEGRPIYRALYTSPLEAR